MRLSNNFSLDEFLLSQTAERQGIDMTPSDEVIGNLKTLCETVLQPLRDLVGSPLIISSGFRPIELNTRIGGSKTSAHVTGRAADFRVIGMTPFAVCETLRDEGIFYDQNIHEFGRWTHVGIAKNNRDEDLTAYRGSDGRVKYVIGIQRIEDLL